LGMPPIAAENRDLDEHPSTPGFRDPLLRGSAASAMVRSFILRLQAEAIHDPRTDLPGHNPDVRYDGIEKEHQGQEPFMGKRTKARILMLLRAVHDRKESEIAIETAKARADLEKRLKDAVAVDLVPPPTTPAREPAKISPQAAVDLEKEQAAAIEAEQR